MKYINEKKFLLISILVHSVFIFLIAVKFYPTTNLIKPGERFIMSYLQQEKSLMAPQPIEKKALKKIEKQNKPLRNKITPPKAKGEGAPVTKLSELLHAAIAAHQHYPASALEMQREGRVRVAFTLLPDGSIRNLHIIHSSGTSSIDQAGVDAVNDAAPFAQVDKYLNIAQDYQLDVVFELT